MNEAVESLNALTPDAIADVFKNNCSKYLKLLGGRKPMYRGMELQYSDPVDFTSKIFIGRKRVRQNRRPMATDPGAFKLVNYWLEKQGWPRRDKSIMTTSDASWAASFGNAYYVFPINPKGYAWVEASDFNNYSPSTSPDRIPSSWSIGPFENLAKNNPELAVQMLKNFVHGNKHFNIAYNRQYETWFDCKQYYFLYLRGMKSDIQNEFKKAFKKVGIEL